MTVIDDQIALDAAAPVAHLSRSIDYLGILGAELRGLQGFAALANELIQNADDAKGATSMAFDVRSDGLVVDNDGVFTDCGHVGEAGDCPWREDAQRKHRCDFHSFQLVASGDKRDRVGTTGAFGIGFTAVYQITDAPHLITAGHHWILHEERPEDRRIDVCGGCGQCQHRSLPGTRFLLPWARDGESALRRGLRAQPVSNDAPSALVDLLKAVLPTAVLFLKQLCRIDVLENGRLQGSYERVEEGDELLVTDGTKTHRWHRLRGNFDAEAVALRQRYPQIEPKRGSSVIIAIPSDAVTSGLLCASLPTKYETGLPFHVNADFYTPSVSVAARE